MTPEEIQFLLDHGQPLPTCGAKGAPNLRGLTGAEALIAATMAMHEPVEAKPPKLDAVPCFTVREASLRQLSGTGFGLWHATGYWWPRRWRTREAAEAFRDEATLQWLEGTAILVEGFGADLLEA